MKKVIAVLLYLMVSAYADSEFSFLLGMRNNHYAFIGAEYASKIGLAVENSVFTQGVEKQYVRVCPYYRWTLGNSVSGVYSLFSGMRYDQEYYDFGARLDLLWSPSQYFQVGGTFMPYYDSFFENTVGYKAYVQSFILEEVGLFAGVKNLPDFRAAERRYTGGLVLKSGHIMVRPELSTPMNGETHLIRASVFFIYNSK